MDKKSALILYDKITTVITSPICELDFSNTYELIIAVILSAQCTDKRVNQVTKVLFGKYPKVEDLANANITDVENIIKPCGFYKVKAKNIINACKKIILWYNSEVPNDFNELLTLDGVGRKTANVVLAVGFNIPALAVDAHVHRVSNRLGITNTNDVDKIEATLKKLYPKELWIRLHHSFLLFGRYVCTARNPHCSECVLKDNCRYYKSLK